MALLKTVLQSSATDAFDFEVALKEYQMLLPSEDEDELLEFEHVLGSSESALEELNSKVATADSYTKRLGTTSAEAPQGHGFINGKHFEITEDFLRLIQVELNSQVQYLQEQIYNGFVTDENMLDASIYFYDLPGTVKRRNRHIFPSAQTQPLRLFNLATDLQEAAYKPLLTEFVYPDTSSSTDVTVWLVADFDSISGREVLSHALVAQSQYGKFRLGFIPNSERPDTAFSLSSVSSCLFKLHSSGQLRNMDPIKLSQTLDACGQSRHGIIDSPIQTVLAAGTKAENEGSFAEFKNAGLNFASNINVKRGDTALLINGRLVGPINSGELTSEDFPSLLDYEISKRIAPVVQAYKNVTMPIDADEDRTIAADRMAKLSSIISTTQLPDPSVEGLFNAPHRPRRRTNLLLDSEYSSFSMGDNTTASFHIAVLLDPVGELAPKWTPLLSWLASLDSVFLQVHLNPEAVLRQMPLKQFYRFSLQPRLTFDENGAEIPPMVEFRSLPPEPIYTLGMDVPSSWLVRPNESHHDLDNVRLASLSGADQQTGVEAIFSLDYLVVEGHAREAGSVIPPRGLQLQLTTSHSTPIADTQVVANLGYLQFKTKPGVFQLGIREGFGREVYQLESVGNEGWNSPPVSIAGTEITVTSLEGQTLYPTFMRKPGMERVDVLAEPQDANDGSGGVMDQIVSKFTSLFRSEPEEEEKGVQVAQAEINIFSVASGLLYERFLSIMILSVLRNTKSTVKFWFIENFLSPSFLEFIPHFAEAYNFQYELVTYKWPSWLRAQKEKQRVIWGYKILFLDVLFPMDLKKVIFVDADQIVRTDLRELNEVDLHGAPYGYTPMGDDNEEMEGFRFWKTGYWKDFLGPKKYHISALYVVDLERFRHVAAGDRLRHSYQELSMDPNSLANLDQDLPNNLQHEVPIFSLDDDWLWCETWCSKDRLNRAKTIDLCQNPLTKEPKLSRARQIPEWEEYDAEIARFARKLADEGRIHSSAATGEVNELASLGGAAQAEATKKAEEAESRPNEEHARDEL